MNLKAADITSGASELLENLQEGISLSDVLSIAQMPKLDQFSEIASTLLPQNLVKIDSNGAFQLLDQLSLQDTIKNGLNSIQGLIESEIKGVIDQVTSTIGQASDVVNSVSDTLTSLGKGDLQDSVDFFDDALGGVSNLLGYMGDTGTLSKYSKTVSDVTNSIKDFSPKQIRDLATDPDYRESIIASTLETATNALEGEVLDTVRKFIQPPTSVEAINSLATTANSLLGNKNSAKNPNEPYFIDVVATTYYGKGPGADLDAYNKKSATGRQLMSGKSCAVDNVKILYGSKVEVPGIGSFDAVDRIKTGGATLQLYYESVTEAAEVQSKLMGPVVVKVTPPKNSLPATQTLTQRKGDSAKLI